MLDIPPEMNSNRDDSGLQGLLDSSITDVTHFGVHLSPPSLESSHVPLQGLDGSFSLDRLSPIHHSHFQAPTSNLSGGHAMSAVSTQPRQLMFPVATSALSVAEIGMNSGFPSRSMSPRGVNDTWNLLKEVALRDQLVRRLPTAAFFDIFFRGN